MKLSKLFYLSALLVPLWSSCSKDSDFHDSPSGTGTRSEIQLVFNGSSDSEIYTRGIATESEMRSVLFASTYLHRMPMPAPTIIRKPSLPKPTRRMLTTTSRSKARASPVRPLLSPLSGKRCLTYTCIV